MTPEVDAYITRQDENRRPDLRTLYEAFASGMPPEYEEGIHYGMIGWFLPHKQYPAGYHCDPKQPLPFASLAAQKNHYGLYLFCVYCDSALSQWFE